MCHHYGREQVQNVMLAMHCARFCCNNCHHEFLRIRQSKLYSQILTCSICGLMLGKSRQAGRCGTQRAQPVSRRFNHHDVVDPSSLELLRTALSLSGAHHLVNVRRPPATHQARHFAVIGPSCQGTVRG